MIAHTITAHGAVAATCTEDGNLAYWKCSVCHGLFSDEACTVPTTLLQVTIEALGHDEVANADAIATCTEAGHNGGTHCSVCGIVLTPSTPVAALGHDWSDWSITIEPTDTEPGSEHRTCSRCSAEENRAVPELGHTHAPVLVETLASTCTVAGHSAYWYCPSCYKYFADQDCTREIELSDTVLELAPHTPASVAGREATCTSTGLTEGFECSVCHAVLSAQEVIPKTAHSLVHRDALGATCTEDGHTEHWECSSCHGLFSDAAGTVPVPESNTVVLRTGHSPETDDAVPATCTSTGLTEGIHCSVCHAVLSAQEIVPMLPHVKVHHDSVDATCTEAGNMEYWECSVCGGYFSDVDCTVQATLDQVTVAARGHVSEKDPAVPATCTSTGLTEGSHCSVCHAVLSAQEIVPALGHAYSATYAWADDGSSCVVHIVCANDGTHKADINAEVASVVKTAATTSSMGVTEFSVSGTHDGYVYASVKEIRNIPALEPEITQVSGTSTYANTVTENQATKVTEIFSTAKDNSGSVEVSVPTAAAGSMTIAFDNAAVNSIAAGDNVTLEATVKESTPEVADAALVIEVKLSGATFSDGKAKVTVPFSQTVPEGKVVKVYFINGDQRQDMNATLADGKVVFETNHFSTYAVVFEDASSSDDGNGGGFPIWVIAVIAVVVLAAAGGAFFFMQRKKA